MRKFFENPEMMISMFDSDITTGALASAAALNAAQQAVNDGLVKLEGITYDSQGRPTLTDAAVEIFEFN